MKNKGGNGFCTTKAVKRIMLYWTSLMEPNQKIPSGFTNHEVATVLTNYGLLKLQSQDHTCLVGNLPVVGLLMSWANIGNTQR